MKNFLWKEMLLSFAFDAVCYLFIWKYQNDIAGWQILVAAPFIGIFFFLLAYLLLNGKEKSKELLQANRNMASVAFSFLRYNAKALYPLAFLSFALWAIIESIPTLSTPTVPLIHRVYELMVNFWFVVPVFAMISPMVYLAFQPEKDDNMVSVLYLITRRLIVSLFAVSASFWLVLYMGDSVYHWITTHVDQTIAVAITAFVFYESWHLSENLMNRYLHRISPDSAAEAAAGQKGEGRGCAEHSVEG